MLLKGNRWHIPLKCINAAEKGTHKTSSEFTFQSGHQILAAFLQFGPDSANSYSVAQRNVKFILGPQESQA